jgi:tetratricopeptide (TPR) repeat protein
VTLLELAAESANASGVDDPAQDYAREAIDLHAAAGDEGGRLRTVGLLGRILLDNGHLTEAVVMMEKELPAERADGADSAEVLANLSRGYMRLDRNQEAIDTADRALKVADPHNLERIVAEALINKASSMHRLGRLREAIALHETAVGLADRNGFVDLQLRGRNNLSIAYREAEPARALKTLYEGIELARRLGQRGMFNWLVGTNAMFANAVGNDIDPSLALLEESLASSPSDYDRARALMVRGLVLARRGMDLDQLVSIAAAAAEGMSDGQITGGLDYLRAEVALIEGRWDDAYKAALKAVEEWPDAEAIVLQVALLATAYTGRGTDASEIKRVLDALSSDTPFTAASRHWAAAVVHAIEARPAEALAAFRAGFDLYRGALGLMFVAGELVISALRLIPGETEVRGWVPEARETFERVNAAPYLKMLDEALEAAGVSSRPVAPPAGRPVESAVETA